METESPDDEYFNAIGKHVVDNIGPVTNVFHEIRPELVQLDLLVVGPTEVRPYNTLITCGMSELPMRVPLENPEDLGLIPELRYAELMMCLPSDWPMDAESFRAEQNFWPIRWLKKLARLPHQQQGWLAHGHTIPNGDPPEPFAENVGFCCWLIDEPVLFPKELQKLRHGARVINFYAAVPLYEDEMLLKLRKGGAALAHMLDRAKVNELIDPRRITSTSRG